ncbi:OLC1v1039194C1 [Oldenlandia corymbosa var. corymbosa]|uniref:OLC1v1039194C1 n=1 Tax=Oldenlandia corymbosa var. corymbosa TaxID=529605 RepID=A0AAV1D1Y1_OLDCO|nr:OLC1v1039194C1 [Oldenlandia corymbosa var. corymbosa]
MEEPELRARSFRYEDYNNRRAFLRSYPLYQDHEDDNKAEENHHKVDNGNGKRVTSTTTKKPMKKIILSVFQWGGETILIFRRFKHKVTFYVITCIPAGLKARTAFISV